MLQLSRQANRTVWYLHDEWLLLGTGHYHFDYAINANIPQRTRFLDLVLKKWKYKHLVGPALGFCVPSNWMMGQLVKLGVAEEKIKVIPNPIPELFFNSPDKLSARRQLGLDVIEKIVLVVASSSNTDKRKGIDLIEPTLISLKSSGSTFQLITVGVLDFDLNSKGIKHKMVDQIESEHDLLKYYASADVMLVPSRLDNLPQVIAEAQSVGLPVVAFNVGGVGESILVPEVSGKLVEPFSTKKASEALRYFLDFSKQTASGVWKTEASKRWSNSKIAEDFVQYIDRLLADSNCNH